MVARAAVRMRDLTRRVRIGSAGPGERPPWNPPGRRWRLAGKPAGPIARAGPGEHFAVPGASPRTPRPGTPRWPAARFLRHRAMGHAGRGRVDRGGPGNHGRRSVKNLVYALRRRGGLLAARQD